MKTLKLTFMPNIKKIRPKKGKRTKSTISSTHYPNFFSVYVIQRRQKEQPKALSPNNCESNYMEFKKSDVITSTLFDCYREVWWQTQMDINHELIIVNRHTSASIVLY